MEDAIHGLKEVGIDNGIQQAPVHIDDPKNVSELSKLAMSAECLGPNGSRGFPSQSAVEMEVAHMHA